MNELPAEGRNPGDDARNSHRYHPSVAGGEIVGTQTIWPHLDRLRLAFPKGILWRAREITLKMCQPC